MTQITYILTDVTKTSLIGPRFKMEVATPGCTTVTFHPSSAAAAAYRAAYFGRDTNVEWIAA